MSTPRERAEAVVRSVRERADVVVQASDRRGRGALRALLRDLRAADELLTTRIRPGMNPELRFTEAQALAARAQIRHVIEIVKARMQPLLREQSEHAVRVSAHHAVELIDGLEHAFAGVASPLRLREAALLDTVRRGVEASLLRRHETSMQRYGEAMISDFEAALRLGLLRGASSGEMVTELTTRFGLRRSWAWRIVRTETAAAYNTARLETLHEAREDHPAMGKKILAFFDQRTAYDSIAVHGQVRALDDEFIDGAGRVYLMPPARPNDRETVIPWMLDDSWEETPSTRMLPASTVSAARERERHHQPAAQGIRERIARQRSRLGA